MYKGSSLGITSSGHYIGLLRLKNGWLKINDLD